MLITIGMMATVDLISDDGKGMNESELKKARKPGSQSPEDERDAGDLGRFD